MPRISELPKVPHQFYFHTLMLVGVGRIQPQWGHCWIWTQRLIYWFVLLVPLHCFVSQNMTFFFFKSESTVCKKKKKELHICRSCGKVNCPNWILYHVAWLGLGFKNDLGFRHEIFLFKMHLLQVRVHWCEKNTSLCPMNMNRFIFLWLFFELL